MMPTETEILIRFGNEAAIYTIIAVVVLTFTFYAWKNKGLPPGPVGLPYLGYLPFLNPDTGYIQLQEIGKKHGKVFSFTITGTLFINLGSITSMREALVTKSECFQQRLGIPNLLQHHLDGGIWFINAEQSKIIRKCFLQLFKERGMIVIKEASSGPMYETIRSIVLDLRNKTGNPVDIAGVILLKCCTVMRQTLFGDDGMSDEELLEFNKGYGKIIKNMNVNNNLINGKFFKFYVHISKGMKEVEEGIKIMENLLIKSIERRKSTYDDNIVRDLIDGYIRERNVRRSKNDPTAKYFTDEVLMVSLIQIVGDSVLFLSLTLCAFVRALIDHPEEQEKIYKELNEVVGMERNPSLEDKSKLTYTNAFILEVIRTSDFLPTFPTLECEKETTLQGYRIPKGSVLFYHFLMANMNADDYEEPEKFNPSRFITTDRNYRPELPVMFGIGKRACLGEVYAMNQIFLYLTTIVKNFRLTKPADEDEKPTQFYLFDEYYIRAHLRG